MFERDFAKKLEVARFSEDVGGRLPAEQLDRGIRTVLEVLRPLAEAQRRWKRFFGWIPGFVDLAAIVAGLEAYLARRHQHP